MSEPADTRRIRVQHSVRDPASLHFLLDAPVQPGADSATFDGPVEGAPLSGALFSVAGVRQVAVDGASIRVRKRFDARWENLKAPIAAAIRATLTRAALPLGKPADKTPENRDARMLAAVRDVLGSRINPSISSHGGRITAERVTGAIVYLRMSGGCQGCAASELTLRGRVERMLRAALPDLRDVVDVTDHEAGVTPFYVNVPDAAAAAGHPLTGETSDHLGPEQVVQQVSDEALPERVRLHLEALPPSARTITYGALARALGFSLPGSVSRVTRALERTMHEDARAGRAFIAARAVSRATDGVPGKGFFDLACELGRGPHEGETEREFHVREMKRSERESRERP